MAQKQYSLKFTITGNNLHIGNGNTYFGFFEIFENDRGQYRVDVDAILRSTTTNEWKRLIGLFKNAVERKDEIRDFIGKYIKNAEMRKENVVLYYFDDKHLEIEKRQGNIREFVKTYKNGEIVPYVPGSSLKGAILHEYFDEKHRKNAEVCVNVPDLFFKKKYFYCEGRV